jgi:hypothetical protein
MCHLYHISSKCILTLLAIPHLRRAISSSTHIASSTEKDMVRWGGNHTVELQTSK